MKKLTVSILAVLGILLGLASMVTPIPGGTLLIIACFCILTLNSEFMQGKVLSARTRFGWLDRLLLAFEGRAGERSRIIRVGLRKTDPSRKDLLSPSTESKKDS